MERSGRAPAVRQLWMKRFGLPVPALMMLLVAAPPVGAEPVTLLTMGLTGGPSGLPLGGGGGTYANVLSTVTFSLSTSATSSGTPGSFFDIYFDIEIEDSDGSANFTNNADKLTLPAPGGLHFSFDGQLYRYEGDLKYPLLYDVNGNSEPDRLAISRIFFSLDPDVSDPTVAFTSMQVWGDVADVSTDPPFGPLVLTGPTTASSQLNPGTPVPEPGTLGLVALGLLGARRARSRTDR